MGTSKPKSRSSNANCATQQCYASSKLSRSLYRIARRTIGEDAQRKIDARHAKPDTTEPAGYKGKGQPSQYPIELVIEALAMVEAGWTARSIARMLDIPYHTLYNWMNQTTRFPSAASMKRKQK